MAKYIDDIERILYESREIVCQTTDIVDRLRGLEESIQESENGNLKQQLSSFANKYENLVWEFKKFLIDTESVSTTAVYAAPIHIDVENDIK